MAKKINLKLGQVVMTIGVQALIEKNPELAGHFTACLDRYRTGDWGDTCKGDKATNDEAAVNKGRIVAAYTIDPSKGKSKGFGENTLWIITEWDRSVTTLLLPDEY